MGTNRQLCIGLSIATTWLLGRSIHLLNLYPIDFELQRGGK
ncbi:hypothetical protein [Photorhabdus asymbiotica]|uniref:Uncharacterized protein n=2 Tax=Photorhabdus TaxID=29487 RepID=A0ABX9SLW6_9GAMM|nr:hypothetical protein [Photorhabdus asymbiotica]RKS57707.1 hypothetical protein BDD30_2518 [Photorhabdus asymbiotica]